MHNQYTKLPIIKMTESQNTDKKYVDKIIEKFDEKLYVDFMRKKTCVKNLFYIP